MQTIPLADTDKYVRDSNSKAILSTDFQALKMYKVNSMKPSVALARATKCNIKTLKKIVNKGEGAFYSSGSRPNQTAQSWGVARLASALSAGKAGAVDYNILNEGCKKGTKGYNAAQMARKRYGYGKHKVPKVIV